jgi:hypothetical protein
VSHGKHEPAVLCGDLAEQFALNPFEVNDGKRAARFRGGENVPRASGNCDLYGLDHGLAELVEIAKRGPVETGTFGGVVCTTLAHVRRQARGRSLNWTTRLPAFP